MPESSPPKGSGVQEIRSGWLMCSQCNARFPILSGVAVLVDDVRDYLLGHVKGISKLVSDSEIPGEVRSEFVEAKHQIEAEHIEEDLEAERVTALYVMNHFLRADQGSWWKPEQGTGSRELGELIEKYWDHGPFEQIQKWVEGSERSFQNSVELGCGVGGLYRALQAKSGFYLGIDSSFASIALARHLVLGASYPHAVKVPADLLMGATSRKVSIQPIGALNGKADYVVGDLESPPVQSGLWDLCVALNTIDMMIEPALLPKIQYDLLNPSGAAVQSAPYIWHQAVAKNLKKQIPKEIQDSAKAVSWLYEKAGFQIEKRIENLPWLFFKHLRQLELYSVDLFWAEKSA